MKTVFITGSTGVIGSSLVPLFLKEEKTRLCLLIRSRSVSDLQRRWHELLDFWVLKERRGELEKRVELISGDVCQPDLGMERESYQRLVKQVTHIIHTAGNVRLNQTIEGARADSLEPAKSMIHFLKQCQLTGAFQKMEYISTIGVSGRMRGVVPERRFTEKGIFRNTYEHAKREAEDFVFRSVEQGCPITVHRPSMVVGDSRSGKVMRFQVFYYLSWFFSGLKTGGFVPETGNFTLDLVPSDYVAEAIYASHQDLNAVGRVFHLVSGQVNSIKISSLSLLLRELFRTNGKRVPGLRKVPLPLFTCASQILRFVSPKSSQRRFFAGLPYFLDYLRDEQQFENVDTQKFMLSHQLSLPLTKDYLERLMVYYFSKTAQKVKR